MQNFFFQTGMLDKFYCFTLLFPQSTNQNEQSVKLYQAKDFENIVQLNSVLHKKLPYSLSNTTLKLPNCYNNKNRQKFEYKKHCRRCPHLKIFFCLLIFIKYAKQNSIVWEQYCGVIVRIEDHIQ